MSDDSQERKESIDIDDDAPPPDAPWTAHLKYGLRWLDATRDYLKVPKAVQRERYALCRACDEFNELTKQCRVCDCFMPLKTWMNISPCPKDKWKLI